MNSTKGNKQYLLKIFGYLRIIKHTLSERSSFHAHLYLDLTTTLLMYFCHSFIFYVQITAVHIFSDLAPQNITKVNWLFKTIS